MSLDLNRLSRRLTKLLRHDADRVKLPVRGDGFALLDDIWRFGKFDPQVLTRDAVLAIVQADGKTRFAVLVDDEDRVWLRANQGHTIQQVSRDECLTRVTSAEHYPVCIHGTTLRAWEEHIRTEGLCRMKRNEIHFAKGEFGQVASGFRKTSEVLVYVDLDKCLAEGIPFYESENGVLLSPGQGPLGVIPPTCFSKVVVL